MKHVLEDGELIVGQTRSSDRTPLVTMLLEGCLYFLAPTCSIPRSLNFICVKSFLYQFSLKNGSFIFFVFFIFNFVLNRFLNLECILKNLTNQVYKANPLTKVEKEEIGL